MKVPLLIKKKLPYALNTAFDHPVCSKILLMFSLSLFFSFVFILFFFLELLPHNSIYIKDICFVRHKKYAHNSTSYNLSTTLDLLYSLQFKHVFFFFYFSLNLALSLYAVNRCIIPRVPTFTPRVRWGKGIKETELILINDEIAWIVFTLSSSVEKQILASESYI